MSSNVQSNRMVVAIDHHGAHVYQHLSASGAAAEEKTIHPYDPHHFHHHLVHRKEAHYKGEHVPEESSFYEEITKQLAAASEIVLIGHGTGKSSAVDHLSEFLEKHHREIFQKVSATVVADLSALTGPQLEALAREHMTAVA